jgi:hypothetical protein
MILQILLWLTDIQQGAARQQTFIYGAFGVVSGLNITKVMLVENLHFSETTLPQSCYCQGLLVHMSELCGRIVRQIDWGGGGKLQETMSN